MTFLLFFACTFLSSKQFPDSEEIPSDHGDLVLRAVPDPHGVAWTAPDASWLVCSSANDQRRAEGEGGGILRGLLASQSYRCVAGTGEQELAAATWTPAALPTDLPALQPDIPNPTMGYFLLNVFRVDPADQTWVLIVDGLGQVRWHMALGVLSMGLDSSWVGDNLLLGGMEVPPTLYSLDYEPIWQFSTTDLEWHHDAGLNEAGDGVLGIVKDDFRKPNDQVVSGGFALVAEHFTAGSARWVWSADEHRDLLWSLADPQHPEDLFHVNSVHDQDGLIYANVRRANSVLVIHKESGKVVEILRPDNVLLLDEEGGVAADDRWFDQAHDAKVERGLFTIYSNESRGKNFRVLTWKLDLLAGEARIIDEWSLPNPGRWYASALGGADRDAEGYLTVAFGDHLEERGSTLFRVAPTGEVTCQLSYPPGYGVYRSEHRSSW